MRFICSVKMSRTQPCDEAEVSGRAVASTLHACVGELIRATMSGAKITCYLDGKKLLETEDSTFADAGMIALWSKADAQSFFDDLTVAE
jgi:hypothetical protein